MNKFAAILLLLCAVALLGAAPPATKVEPVTETIHGVEIVDPYRWLEGSASPELGGEDEDLDRRVSAWTDEQNALTRSVLDGLPGRKNIEARLRELMEVGTVRAPTMRENRYFYTKREGDQAQAALYLREGAFGEPRVLLDPNTLHDEGLISLGWYTPSHDGRLLAYGTYLAGDENTTLYLMDVDTGEMYQDVIENKVRGVFWRPDGSGIFYRCLADPENPYSAQIKYHGLGTDPAEDPLLFEQYKEGPLATTWGPSAGVSEDGRWMILSYSTGTDSNDLYAINLDRWLETGSFDRIPIVEGKKAMSSGFVIGNTLYMSTTLDAPNRQLLAVDLTSDDPSTGWKLIIPEDEDAVLESVGWAKGILVADYLTKAHTRIELFDLQGVSKGVMELPGLGSAGVSVKSDRTEAFLTYTSYNEPRTIYHIDLATGAREIWERPDVPVDPSPIQVDQVWYTSKDGTPISMFVVHNKDLVKDGTNPTILSGYGGFNVSMRPRFSATMFPWFEGGGVLAIPNLRGGGEYGEAWHRAGMLDQKQNVFDDFIAAAEWLIENKYTDSEHLGISGGSNGGLLTGAVVIQRPDLFSAVISAVPLLDMIRYQNFLMARYWVPEYGTAENPDHLEFLMEYSPYHNVKDGTAYPSVLFTAGENDTRVHALHARKMAARMQAATTSNPNSEPVLLWVNRDAGHGQGKPLHLRVRDVADQRMFMMWQLGMLDPGAP